MTDKTDILIVGAGPSGLMLACQLIRHEIDFIILDNSTDIKRSSGALVIHAASMELFYQMGILEQVLSQAISVNSVDFALNNYEKKHSFNLPSSGKENPLNQKYPPIILLEQYKMEGILQEFITKSGKGILKGTFLGYMQNAEDEIVCTTDIAGITHSISCRFLIGADGKSSTVRKLAGITFQKIDDNRPIFILDFEGFAPTPPNTMFFFFSTSISLGCFPLKEKMIRLDGYIPSLVQNKMFLKAEHVLPFLPVNIQINKIKWFSVFHGNHMLCDNFSKGQIFLIGDAAHTHNPVGGQGMNSGFQDALNLAWKLAFVIQGLANDKLLDTYTSERRPVVKKIMDSSSRIFRVITRSRLTHSLLLKSVFPVLMPFIKLLSNFQRVKQRMYVDVSQLWIKYKSQLIVPDKGCSRLIPGMLFRASLLEINLRQSSRYRLLVFQKSKTPVNYQELETFPIDISIVEEHNNPFIFQAYSIKKNTTVLLRPDNFIAMSTIEPDLKAMQQYFRELM